MKKIYYWVFIITTLVFSYNLIFLNALGIGVFFVFILKFINELSKKVDIRNYIVIISLIQWVVAPTLKYSFFPDTDLYYMSVDEKAYFLYVIPGVIIFIIGLFFPLKKQPKTQFFETLRNELHETSGANFKIGLLLITIGIFSFLYKYILPASLNFVVYLLDGLKYVGAIYILYSNKKYRYLIFTAIFLSLIIRSGNHGMFHDLIIWSVFFFMIHSYQKKYSVQKNTSYILIISISIIIIQSLKPELRGQLWYGNQTSDKNIYFSDLVIDRITNPNKLLLANNISSSVTRANQGWIISRIMSHVPEEEPYANGYTIIRGIKSSLLPRFITSDKALAGGKEYFEKYTGQQLAYGTSMDLSIIGESYANFGIYFGIAFMFVLGLLFNFILSLVLNQAKRNPTMVFWIPFLFLQIVKAENDFTSGINHFVKASIIVWIFFTFVSKKYIKIRTNVFEIQK
jgi:hypothetical protein